MKILRVKVELEVEVEVLDDSDVEDMIYDHYGEGSGGEGVNVISCRFTELTD